MVMTRVRKRTKQIQAYRCIQGHYFQYTQTSAFDDSFIELVVYIYLECLSLQTTVAIIRAIYDELVLSKAQVLGFVETVADTLPALDDIDRLFTPVRSGYLAFDGVWFKLQRKDIVLLVAFDPETFDVVAAQWQDDETEEGYEAVLTQAVNKMGATAVRGVYSDGDHGFIRCKERLLPHVPLQLCVFHKELRMGQIIPVPDDVGKHASEHTKESVRP
jgi:hypothetical protein